MRAHWLIAFLLLSLTFAVYFQVREHEFVDYDDHRYFLENPNLADGLTLDSLGRAFGTTYMANWTPLTSLSLQLDHALYGLEPAGYLLTNVAIHALAALLLFLAFARMTGAPWPSAFVAAVFAVHPLHVESVAWASERKDALCGLFWMFTLCAYARYAEQPGKRRYAPVALGVALALLAKPVAVTLPLALLLLDYWPLARLRAADSSARFDAAHVRRALLEKLPLIALALLASAITYLAQDETGVVRSAQFPVTLRVANAIQSYALYLGDALWPTGLAAFYPYPAQGIPGAALLLAALVLAAISAVALQQAAKRPYLISGWLWFLGTLIPMSGLVQVGLQARADRYTYIPLIGLTWMLAFAARDGAQRFRVARLPIAIAGALAVCALSIAAWFQVGIWRDTQSLFEHAVAVTDDNYLAHHRLAALFRARGDDEAAEIHYRETVRLAPHWAAPQFELASLLEQRGAHAEAVPLFRSGLELEPDHFVARKLLGGSLLALGRYPEAHAQLMRALAGGEDLGTIHAALGIAAAALGRTREAVEHNRAALAYDPANLSAANNLAWTLATHPDGGLRDPDEAIAIAEAAAARSEPAAPDLLDTLAAAYAAAGRFADAVRAETDAIRAADLARDSARARDFGTRLALYAAGRAYVGGAGGAAENGTALDPAE